MSRPLSACNNKTSLTNFNTKFSMEIIPKTVNYHPDGMGRDSYIKSSNGGFLKEWSNNYRNQPTSKILIKYSKDF